MCLCVCVRAHFFSEEFSFCSISLHCQERSAWHIVVRTCTQTVQTASSFLLNRVGKSSIVFSYITMFIMTITGPLSTTVSKLPYMVCMREWWCNHVEVSELQPPLLWLRLATHFGTILKVWQGSNKLGYVMLFTVCRLCDENANGITACSVCKLRINVSTQKIKHQSNQT